MKHFSADMRIESLYPFAMKCYQPFTIKIPEDVPSYRFIAEIIVVKGSRFAYAF